MMNTIQNMYTYCTSLFFSFRLKRMAMEMELVQPQKKRKMVKGENGRHEEKRGRQERRES